MCTNRHRQGAQPCLYCYTNLKCRTNFKGHLGYRPYCRPQEYLCMGLKKPTTPLTPSTADVSSASSDGGLMLLGKLTWEMMTEETWDDGTARVPCSLLVFWELGKWKLCLNDRGLSRTGWVTGSTPSEAFDRLEQQLLEDRLDWRKARPGRR